MTIQLEMGLHTFGDITADGDGTPLPHAVVIRHLVEQAIVADASGVDFIGVGEHHRRDFAVSAPEVVLAAIAARTSRIKLGSATTVLSSDDPIRVFQRFSTLDAVSNGRAEVILGRGSFTESFHLFGLPLEQYDRLFSEKLDLFAALLTKGPTTFYGELCPSLRGEQIFPPLERGALGTWIGVGGNPASIFRAAAYRFPVMFAIIGGNPERFLPLIDLHHRAYQRLEEPPQPVGVHSPGYVAATDEQAQEEFWPAYKAMHDHLGRERGWPALQRSDFDRETVSGSLYVGSPSTVARRIATTVKTLGVDRFDLKYSAGPLSHEKMLRSVELFGTQVIPLTRQYLDRDATSPVAPAIAGR